MLANRLQFLLIAGCCLVATSLSSVSPLVAADDAPKTRGAAKAAPTDVDTREDPYSIPENLEPEAILDFLEEMMERPPQVTSRKAMIAHFVKVQEAIIGATAEILETPKIEEEIAIRAAEMRLEAATILASAGMPGGQARAVEIVGELKKDSRPKISELASAKEVLLKILALPTLSAKERQSLATETLSNVKTSDYGRGALQNALQLGGQLERLEDPAEAATFYMGFAKLLEASSDEQLQGAAAQMFAMARRVGLIGNEMVIEGTTLDGAAFDWKSYRGKVVLVDFWATWCGPCIAELPNVKRLYSAYHDLGFDVVGISLDDDLDALSEFLKDHEITWTTLFEQKDGRRGWENPTARYYGISGIPTAILVDQSGKVVSLMARGENLAAELEKLLGPVELKEETEKKPAVKKKLKINLEQ